ncbi:MAG: class I SAM-dependent methyltransferase [Lachnospiraceae bacterium]|nr:class I SAM-dependent methyltransferase [Lachnospiraceae bacterium]
MKCRYCGKKEIYEFIDLGQQPLANDYLTAANLNKGQYHLPLKVGFCETCGLVQVIDYELPDNIFNENYKYFSSYSSSWLKHCQDYVDMIVKRLHLDSDATVLEIASNDGYLLQYFNKYHIPVWGIEPSESVAEIAIQKGIRTEIAFFTEEYAKKNIKVKPHLIIGNNVLAHVPDIGGFIRGLKLALADNGTITMEFPSVWELIKHKYFDTIYHEHFSYLSFNFVCHAFRECGLEIYDVELLATHGGSLRIYAKHVENQLLDVHNSVGELLAAETSAGISDTNLYKDFGRLVRQTKFEITSKLLELKSAGKSIVGYGAAAKGNTLFNFVGIDKDFLDFVVDKNPHKQNLYLPGSEIPIYGIEEIKKAKPEYILIIPWNLKKEIENELAFVRTWGGKFMVLLPEVAVW